MTRIINFTKMHGAGNDYIYVNVDRYPLADPARAAVEWSRPHTGIGSDGLVLVSRSDVADFAMRIFNADGSEAMMCGNASRCIGKYVYDNHLTRNTTVMLDTLSGIKVLRLHMAGGRVDAVTVDMGEPTVGSRDGLSLTAAGREWRGVVVSMGNPHLVIFTDDVEGIDLPVVGPAIECHPLFPGRTNVEFARVGDDGSIRMRVWERGSGITMACGTGACATAVAACLTGRAGRKADVVMDGGRLTVEWDEATGHVLMTGGAVKVFDGTIETDID